ncbi:N6-adenine-specific methylase, putative [Plasmodium sp. gorilla clade G2]|uniref:N6-adenine-specific methylase, putative n=1 Tax=Plasmodium sp. gorilla clade G2 TaxID=880535 RepID=UPI000D21A493|nr:N6-adenine-specific methylase, putative [Plasmodium sp. gorilla clade G2]SOV18276.1 N6-adenine-specific methylase, putative [Plasmodium sp. gorilla clade G2]
MIFVKPILLLYLISLFLNNLNTYCNFLKFKKKKNIDLLYKLSKINENKNVVIKKKRSVSPLYFIKVYPLFFKNKVAFQNVNHNYVYTLKGMERNEWRMQDEKEEIQNEENIYNNSNKDFLGLDGDSKNIVENMNHIEYKKDNDNNKKENNHDNINNDNNNNNNNNNDNLSNKGKKRIIERDMYGIPKEKLNIKRQTNKNIKSKYGYCKIKTYNETININYRKKKILSILEGTLKNKKLYSPDTYTRPMMSKVKESLFSVLTHLNIFNGYNINVLDVFTGSGNLGIECISRDVENVTFVDLSLNSCRTVYENLRLCNIYDTNKKILRADAMELLQNPYKFNVHEKYNLGFFTPPYEQIIYSDLIHNISNSKIFDNDCLIFIEYPKEINLLPKKVGNLIGLRNRKFGRTYYALYVINSTGKYIPYQNENEFYPLHYNRKQRRQEKYIE